MKFIFAANNNELNTLTSYMKELEIDDDYDCWVEEKSPPEPWYTVENKKREKRYKLWDTKIEQGIAASKMTFLSTGHHDLTDVKSANRRKFDKQGDAKRHNTRELKRKALRERIHKRNARLSKKKNNKSVSPHGLEDDCPMLHSGSNELPTIPEEDEEQSTEETAEAAGGSTQSTATKERNELARLAISTPPQVVEDPSDELSELLCSITDIANVESSPEMDNWVSHLENIVIMAYQVSRAQSFTDVFVAVIAYIKMNTQKSILKQIFNLIDEVTTVCKKDEVTPHAWTGGDIVQKWELFKTNTIFTKISYLLSAAMSLSVCTIKEIEWSPFGLKLIAVEAAKEQLKAVDVIDAVIGTFTWCAETGYRVFQERSLMPLLYADQKMSKFNETCDWVLANAEQAVAGNLGEINDFEHKVDDVLRQVCEMKQVKQEGPTALWLQKRYSELVSLKHKIVAKHRNTAIRFAPFGVGITGPSGVGKSTLSKLVMKTSLHAMGFETDPKRIITKDMFDKYDSTYTSDILGMFMDDVGNGKAEFAQVSPTDVIIKFFNNMAAQAVKAELNAKGVVFIAFKVGVLTSNFEDYNVRLFTCKPEASLRRFIHTRTRIKPKYRKPGSVSLDPEHPDLCASDLTQDVWELDIEECFIYETKTGKDAYKFRIMTVDVDGEKIYCKNLDLSTYLDVIIALAKRHKMSQESVMKRSEDFDKVEMCATCCRPKPMCKCVTKPHGFEQLGDIIADAAQSAVKSYISKWLSPVQFLNSIVGYRPVKSMATRQLANEMKHVLNETATPWLVAATPDWLFRTSVFKKSVLIWQRSAAAYDLRRQLQFGLFLGSTMIGLSIIRKDKCMFGSALGGSWLGSMVYWSQYRARVEHYKEEYMRRRNALPDFAKQVRESNVVKGAFVVSTLVVGLKLFRMWNKARLEKKTSPAGSLKNMDEQPSWFGFMMTKMGLAPVQTDPIMKHVTSEQLRGVFKRNNLFWADFERADGSRIRCNIFFPRKCVAWFPQHIFYPGSNMTGTPSTSLKVVVHRDGEKAGGVFTFKCEYDSVVKSDKHDLVCVYVPNCPDLKNRLIMLPLDQPKGTSTCQLLVRRQGDYEEERVTVEYGTRGHMYKDFYGGSYTTKLARDGSCMGLLLSESKTPFLAGFHIGGNVLSNYGVMQTVTKAEADELIAKLEQIPGVLLSAQAVEIPKTQYGRELIVSKDVHPHCMAAKLGSDAYIDVLGSTRLRSQMKSTVQQSAISESVTEEFGVPNKWGAPQLQPNWKNFNATLEHIVNPADMFSHSALEKARQDWLKPLFSLMAEYIKTEDFRPLNDHEMVCGVEGKRFLDALPMQTSMGFPVFGPKSKYFEEIRDGEKLVTRVPNEEVKAEMSRLLECWKRGERGYPVTTATLKDEPTPIDKAKVRVFQAGSVALGLYIRKYFLPIARFLSLHPLESESAVGVNAFSQQWEELMDHANKFATDNLVIAWDYSKYDVRMNSQITRAVFLSFIELAKVGGYDAQSLEIMRMMVSDIVHPLIDYNGTMIMAYNMNTSGNNVTVNVNSTAGSFYVRLGFFNEFPDEKDFRSKVAAMTYGDDFKGSVHVDYRKFNFLSYKKFLADHGMKITLPDKGDNEVDLMDDKDADFLKRHSQYIPEIGCKIGKLDEMSIFKSLHSNLQSKSQTPLEVSISCIETAMHEWFAHGREVYEQRQTQMKRVCSKFNLLIPAVSATYDERVEHWLSKYRSA